VLEGHPPLIDFSAFLEGGLGDGFGDGEAVFLEGAAARVVSGEDRFSW
jgi:hypothetical protein